MDKEASGKCKTQTEKDSSITLKRGQKYDYLQFMEAPKTVYKHARNAMQNEAQKWLKHKVYKTFIEQPRTLNKT